MTTRGQNLRSSTPGQSPPAGTRLPGELWINFADLQMGYIDAGKNAQRVVAVRYFSTAANYAIGEFVIQSGALYVAMSAVSAGAFNSGQWTKIATMGDIPTPYVLPVASPTVLGGVKVDNSSITIASGVISAAPPVLPPPYTLPVATTSVLGGVKADGATIKVAGDGTLSTAPPSAGVNRIINGDMRVDQRNLGASGTTAGYAIDRWAFVNSSAPTGRGAWQQITAAGGPLIGMGFGYYLNFASSGAYTPAAADNFGFFQAIEADMVTDLLWGTANAQPITLSFLASSTLTGQFGGVIANAKTGTRVYPFSFNLPVASTWTKISITIPGDTAAGWTMNGNGIGVVVRFDLGSGANFRAAAGAWTGAGDIRGATGDVNVVGTNGAVFNLTAVKLELGSVATPFPRQTLAKTLFDCQRYFQKTNINWSGNATTGIGYIAFGPLPVNPRASATLTAVNNGNIGFPASGTLAGGGPAVGTVSDTRVCSATTTGGGFGTQILADAEL